MTSDKISSETSNDKAITIIGSGCAGLSLAGALGHYRQENEAVGPVHLQTDISYQDRPAHIWGFWQMPWLLDATTIATHHWTKWRICDDRLSILHESQSHPYHMLSSQDWLSHCFATSKAVEQIAPHSGPDTNKPAEPYFDSRPKQVPDGAIYQHFKGQWIEADEALFDPDIATLMDFRCDQSQGLHFIYLLPISPHKALVESTLFTKTPLDDSYYETAISEYMACQYKGASYQVIDSEKGVIPMADTSDRISPDHAIGARGGALRPSSGYAFSYIQQQVTQIISDHKQTGLWRAKSPLSATMLWMDLVFLEVLKARPKGTVALFMRMAKALTGREFAHFMAGTASVSILLKVVFAMPKWPFLIAAMRVLFGKIVR